MDLLILCFMFLLSFRLKHWRMNSVTAINVHPNFLLYPYLVICSQWGWEWVRSIWVPWGSWRGSRRPSCPLRPPSLPLTAAGFSNLRRRSLRRQVFSKVESRRSTGHWAVDHKPQSTGSSDFLPGLNKIETGSSWLCLQEMRMKVRMQTRREGLPAGSQGWMGKLRSGCRLGDHPPSLPSFPPGPHLSHQKGLQCTTATH